MSDEEQTSTSLTTYMMYAVVIVVALYVLSIGPVIAAAEYLDLPHKPFEIIYFPIFWLAINADQMKTLQWYAAFWGWH